MTQERIETNHDEKGQLTKSLSKMAQIWISVAKRNPSWQRDHRIQFLRSWGLRELEGWQSKSAGRQIVHELLKLFEVSITFWRRGNLKEKEGVELQEDAWFFSKANVCISVSWSRDYFGVEENLALFWYNLCPCLERVIEKSARWIRLLSGSTIK